MNEATRKKVCTVLFQLYKVLKQAKSVDGDRCESAQKGLLGCP